ncbi:MAG: ABC transporter permease [Bacteroidales bacterium]|nr:ABC transporter permease [Bacteroidales bacterium]
MKILFALAWRNLWRNRKRTLITISSVLFAVLLAIVFISFEQGSYERMIDSMVKLNTGYIQIQDILFEEEPSIDNTLLYDDQLEGVISKFIDQVDFVVPRIQNFALVATDKQTRGSMIIGIDPGKEVKLNNLADKMADGNFLQPADEEILLAKGLAEILAIKTGDTLILLSQGFQGATAAGKFVVKGIVDLKIPELNNNTVYMSLEAAQWFYVAENRLTSLIVMPKDPKNTRRLAAGLSKNIDHEWQKVLTWEQLLADLLQLMKFDQAGTKMMTFILYIVIAFGLFGTVLTMMIERQREFGMLISIGLKRHQLATICFLETLMISFTGVLAGMIIAIPVVVWFYIHPIQLTGDMARTILEYGFEPIMPFSTDPWVFVSQAKIVLIISLVIGLYPIYKILKLNIMEVRQ